MRIAIAAPFISYEAQKLQAIVDKVKIGCGSWRTVGQARLESMSAMPRLIRRAFEDRPEQWALAIGGTAGGVRAWGRRCSVAVFRLDGEDEQDQAARPERARAHCICQTKRFRRVPGMGGSFTFYNAERPLRSGPPGAITRSPRRAACRSPSSATCAPHLKPL